MSEDVKTRLIGLFYTLSWRLITLARQLLSWEIDRTSGIIPLEASHEHRRFSRVNELAKKYEPEMTRFLRDMIRIPSESCQEEGVIRRIKEEMEKVGFDRVEIDKMGNVLGFIGNGPRIIAFDAHIDTVGVGNRSNWTFDPYEGYEDAETIGGRGASESGRRRASMVYAGKIIKELGLCPKDCTIVMVGNGAGRGLRRPVLAIHHQRRRAEARICGIHRTHRRRHLSRPARAHGNPRGRKRRILPRFRPGTRRQRHLPHGPHHDRA